MYMPPLMSLLCGLQLLFSTAADCVLEARCCSKYRNGSKRKLAGSRQAPMMSFATVKVSRPAPVDIITVTKSFDFVVFAVPVSCHFGPWLRRQGA